MRGLIWSPRALKDVRKLYNFPFEKDMDAARKAVGAIRSAMRVLEHHPEIGRPVEGMAPEYRERLIDFGSSGFAALYRYENETSIILAVRHQKEAGY